MNRLENSEIRLSCLICTQCTNGAHYDEDESVRLHVQLAKLLNEILRNAIRESELQADVRMRLSAIPIKYKHY